MSWVVKHLANFSGGAPGRLPQGRSVFERIGRAMRVFQNWWAPRGGGGECSEMFGTCSELVRASPSPLPLLSPGRWFFQKWSELVPKMFGIVGCLSPWVVAPPPPPANLRKWSEMFGNVRKMFGTGPAAPPTLPPGRPHLSRTFSEQFPIILAGTTTQRRAGTPRFRTCSEHVPNIFGWHPLPGEGWGSGHTSSEHFPNISEHFRRFAEGGGYHPGGEAPNNSEHFPNIVEGTTTQGRGGGGPPVPVPNIFRTFSSTSLTQCDIGPSPDQGPQQNYLVKLSPRVRRPVVGPLELTNLPTTRPSYP